MAAHRHGFFCNLCLLFLPSALAAQSVIDIGRFEEDVRISNFLATGGLGRSVATGEVNGDGVHDVLAGAEVIDRFYLGGGGAFLILGSAVLPRLIDLEKPYRRVAFWGNGQQDYTGDFVELFDFSGDGLADVFISAPQWNYAGGNLGQGKIYFHQGRSSWPSEITLQDYPTDGLSATLHGERPKSYLGAGLAHGDFNGDGIQDLATVNRFAARPGPLSQQATVYIIWGGQELVNGTIDNPALAHCTIVPPAENQVAMWVHTANFDGDAFDELILTLSNAEVDGVYRAGAGFILWGAKDWPQSIDLANWQQASNVTRLVSHRYGAYMTARLATGDFDGSGIIDLAAKVYVPGWQPGLVHVYHDPFKGRPKFFDYFDQKHRTTVIADKHLSHYNFPYNLASLDWNDDGLDDLVISNTLAHREWPRLAAEGVVYVVHGSPTLPDSIDLQTNNAKWDVIWGGSHVANIGESMAKGDLDSDGKDDLIIGAWTATTNAGEGSGELYVLLNRDREPTRPIPVQPSLLPVAPNPFHSQTVAWFEVSQREKVRLEIFDLLGRQVRLLRDGELSAGTYSAIWNGRNEQGNPAASGIYIAVLRVGEKLQKQKLLLIR